MNKKEAIDYALGLTYSVDMYPALISVKDKYDEDDLKNIFEFENDDLTELEVQDIIRSAFAEDNIDYETIWDNLKEGWYHE